jgi:hypothetical protein
VTGGHPDGLPDRFLDRSVGRHQVATALRREGLRVRTLAEVYGVPADEEVLGVEWLQRCGDEGWVVLMKDDRIRYRPAERETLVRAGTRAFCLSSGNLRAAEMAELFVGRLAEVVVACADPGPFLYTISRQGIRAVTL